MLCGQSVEGRDEAIAAEQYFASKQRLDSDLYSTLLIVEASNTLVDHQAKERYARKAIDILSALEHNWGPEVLRTYILRPDLHSLMRPIPRPMIHAVDSST